MPGGGRACSWERDRKFHPRSLKVRSTPLRLVPPQPRRTRAQACRNGLFAMPHGLADPNPIVEGLRLQSLVVYNSVAELMNVKQQNYGEDLVASYGAERLKLERELCKLNKIMNRLRLIGFKIREYIMKVELGRPLNEPRDWNRQ
ncbi:uncharacterized protein LOC125544070 isoform X2 [Triticum urartu]|uniref:uncharacterized protein LOC125544070 isoform X2 n=1 Tax=Triticum urartu TaxID=4572 RepID=UPI002043293D|nr:uncharacterized protein LOC125544070 isoform X2 [Triticum urartu]